ncbi:MAG: hypothetical protein IKD73_02770 [Selenomonadaceae bacterium]|nr:hypothetical protein [Selenomonadaceae bacterium]
MGFNKNQVAQFQKLALNPDAVQEAIDYAENNNTIPTRTIALMKVKQAELKRDLIVQAEALLTSIEKLDGLFDVIVIDAWKSKALKSSLRTLNSLAARRINPSTMMTRPFEE